MASLLVDLPTGEPSPIMRLHQVAYQTRVHREAGQALSAPAIVGIAGFAPPTLHSLGARVASGLSRRLFNLVVTNVPGPQHPLYLDGSRMLASYPVIPLARGQALAIGLTSYDGGVHYGLNGDREAMPDLDDLRRCIVESLAELVEAARVSRRWGLVLGGGGVLGGAWTVGALSALQEVHGLDARDAELIVGTSAGSVTAALLGAGVAADDLRAHQLGAAPSDERLATAAWSYDSSVGGAHPPRPHFHVGSAALVTRNVSRWRRMPPTAVLAGLMPEGRGSLAAVGALVAGLVPTRLGAAPRRPRGRPRLRHRAPGGVRLRAGPRRRPGGRRDGILRDPRAGTRR